MRALIFLFVVLLFSSGECSLELYTFNVGQGVFSLFKKNEKALIVDCGGTQHGRNLASKYDRLYKSMGTNGQILKDIMKDIISCDVVYTHNHGDHRNIYKLIKTIVDLINNERKKKEDAELTINEYEGREVEGKKL